MKLQARTLLALLAFVSATLAAMGGGVAPPPAADEISAVDLAQWLRARRPGLLLVDLRAAEAFEGDRLPGARLLADVDTAALRQADTVVVYADAGADAAAPRGISNMLSSVPHVLRLYGGIAAWNDEVLFPVLRADAGARQQREFETRALLSRYFGGSPRLLDPGASPSRGRSRRGC